MGAISQKEFKEKRNNFRFIKKGLEPQLFDSMIYLQTIIKISGHKSGKEITK